MHPTNHRTPTLHLCDGAWRLTHEGEWLRFRQIDVAPEVEEMAQTLATLCATHLDPGTEVTLRLGATLLVCSLHSDGVRVGWKRSGGNPLVLTTMLEKAELESKARPGLRSPARPVLGEPEAAHPEIPHPDLAPIQSSSALLNGGFSRGLEEDTAMPVEDVSALLRESKQGAAVSSWSRDPRAAKVLDLTRGEKRVASISLGDEESEALSFEIEYEMDPDDAEEQLIAAYTSRRSEPAREVHDPRIKRPLAWTDFERIYENLRDLATRQIGPRVVDNYWRTALMNEPELRGLVAIEAEGGLEFLELNADVDGREASWMLAVIDQWLTRCERVVPDEAAQWRQLVARELDAFMIETKEMP